jgi:hypothetical protein
MFAFNYARLPVAVFFFVFDVDWIESWKTL